MDVRQLEYFLAVVDHGGFNRAATALYLSQPSLSQAIRTLERDLGSDLFHRIGRRVVLTEAGTALIEPARTAVRGLELARASVESVHGLRIGRVEIAAMPSQAVAPLTGMISRFHRAHPEVSVTVRAAFTPRDVTEMVRTGVTELGLLASPDIAGRGTANPLGAVWSAAMMLDHLGHPEAAGAVTDAIATLLSTTRLRTPDLGGTATTAEFTAGLIDLL